jgi:hypothetical protein
VDSKAPPPSLKGRAGSPHCTTSGPSFGPAPQDSTASAPYRTPLPLVEILMGLPGMSPCLLILSNCTSITPSVSDHKLLCITCSIVPLYLPTLLAVGHKSSTGHLFYCFCPCFQHWVTSPLWVTCSMAKSHTSPLWVTCFGVGRLFSYQVPHKSSVGHLFRCGSSVLQSCLTQALCGSLVSV